MKIYISADIEGIAGVVAPHQGQLGNAEYERARRLMTEEVNAAISGAFTGGATEVLVNDGHGQMLNLLSDQLDPRAELILGKPKPANMFAGVNAGYAGVMCVGYHAGAGERGVLSHTTSGAAFRAVRLNGRACSEAALYGAYAGSLGVPVILVSGDDATAESCGTLFPGAQIVTVKHALGHRAARALSPAVARDKLKSAAEAAVRAASGIVPLRIPGPYRIEFDFATPALADLAAVIPVSERTGPVTVAFTAASMDAVLGWLNTLSALSAFLQ